LAVLCAYDHSHVDISRSAEVRGRLIGRAGALALAAAVLVCGVKADGQQDSFRFRTGIELINVSVTVTDQSGAFVSGLAQGDFVVFEDEQAVEVTHFSAERVPVSLGIVLDTSGSMAGPKIAAARVALERFLFDLLGPEDEVFLYRFDSSAHLVAGWTTDRNRISTELRHLPSDGATALYDAVSGALPLLQSGRHRKKALLVISDGNDTSSRADFATVKRLIRESEALVYAIGIDTQTTVPAAGAPPGVRLAQRRRPFPLPLPGSPRRPPPRPPTIPGVPPGSSAPKAPRKTPADEPAKGGTPPAEERVNVSALRALTDDSGGRTEIVRDARDLAATTARIADELSRQYYLAYPARAGRDGLWHAIRVEVRDSSLHVRARRGYLAPQ
jgi:VWFA-related protein